MAKTIMPLLSAEASGKLANSMVYFYWKGLNVVRKYTIPGNPRDPKKKIVRTKFAAMGKNLLAITTKPATEAKIIGLIKAVAPANLIWNSCFVKATLGYIKSPANWTLIKAAYTAATAAIQFVTSAAALGMAEMATGVEYTENVPAAFQLYLGAYAAYVLGLSGTANYASDPAAWPTATLTNFALDYTSA